MKFLSSPISAALVGMVLAASSVTVACQSANVKFNPVTQQYEFEIVGDDGQMVQARGIEQALQQAIQNKANADLLGNQAGSTDWNNIINRLIAKKESGGGKSDEEGGEPSEELIAEGNETGSVEQEDDGSLVWTWGGGSDG